MGEAWKPCFSKSGHLKGAFKISINAWFSFLLKKGGIPISISYLKKVNEAINLTLGFQVTTSQSHSSRVRHLSFQVRYILVCRQTLHFSSLFWRRRNQPEIYSRLILSIDFQVLDPCKGFYAYVIHPKRELLSKQQIELYFLPFFNDFEWAMRGRPLRSNP